MTLQCRRPNVSFAMAFQAAVRTVSFRKVGAAVAPRADWGAGSRLLDGLRGTSRVVARAPGFFAALVVCFFIGAVADKAVCAENKTGAAQTKKERNVAQPHGVSGVATTDVGQ